MVQVGVVCLWIVCGCGRVAFDPLSDAGCPAEYVTYGASCYRFFGGGTVPPSTWLDAETACENDEPGGHLVVVDDAAELALFPGFVTSMFTWVGITDRITEGTYLGVTGVAVPQTPWLVAEPSGTSIENCAGAQVYGPPGIQDRNCDELDSDWVCELDGMPPLANAF